MLRLLAQLTIAGVLIFGLRASGMGLGWRVVAVTIGVLGVHFFWKRFIVDPYVYLGAMPVAEDDPIMRKAEEEARGSLPQFLALFPTHRDDSMVKAPFQTDSGATEYLWGDLLDVVDGKARVYIRTLPQSHRGSFERNREVDLGAIVDWQIEFRDGTLRGGYTMWALLKIYERQEGRLHPKLRAELARFRDLDVAEPASVFSEQSPS